MLIIIFALYQFFQIITLPVFIIYLLFRARKKSVFGNLKERLGFVPKPSSTKHVIWIHAVSVGETLATEHLVNHLKQQIPDVACYQTTGTPSGKAMIAKHINANVSSFLPFDFLPCMLLAFARIKPKAIIIIEAEQWPNLLMLAKLKNIPVYALSAKLSERSFNRYKKLGLISKSLFSIFAKIFAQTELDAARFKNLGIARDKITLLGDLKAFNVFEKRKQSEKKRSNPSIPQDERQLHPAYITLLIGSVHPGELPVYLELFRTLKQEFTHLKMIIAPRHFHWKDDLIKQISDLKLSYQLWDEQNAMTLDAIPETLVHNDILVICKLGVLFDVYHFADIFYLGGTFVPVGGHNLLEPAVWGNPSFVGPYHINCKAHADALEKAHGLIKVHDGNELTTQTRRLLEDKDLRTSMGNNCQSWLIKEATVVRNNLEMLFSELQK